MTNRRILSLWFPRLGAERHLRHARVADPLPLAVIREVRGARIVDSLAAEAEARGVRRGQTQRDALAICPDLVTRPHEPAVEAATLAALRRWAGRFSPWVAGEAPDGLIVDLTGCAHLFGGETALLDRVTADCARLGLTVRAGLADTLGAAWALARHGQPGAAPPRSGDAIDQEARATRSRAARRPVSGGVVTGSGTAIAPPGGTLQALAPLPVAGLRLDPGTVEALARLGLNCIGDLTGLPRAVLARRFGREPGLRLDQALGVVPEPVSPAGAPEHFAARLSLPEPVGLVSDIEAGIDRLLPPLCARLDSAGRGARRVRLQAFRCDHGVVEVEIGLARPAADPARIRPLLVLKLDALEAGPGIDMLRLEAVATEPVHARQVKGHVQVARDVAARMGTGAALDDLVGRLGARIGTEAVLRLHPAESHIPEKTAVPFAAAWSEPARHWPPAPAPRPLLLWPPEPVTRGGGTRPDGIFRWRRRDWEAVQARGPERIAPEWWLDDPAWRSGLRDYWEVLTACGVRLWLYRAHGGTVSGGWFCHGSFD